MRILFETRPNSLKLLDYFLMHQAGVSERRAFTLYLDWAALMHYLLRE